MSETAPISIEFQILKDGEARSKIESVGGSLASLDTKARGSAESGKSVGTNYATAALGITSAATGVLGLWTNYDALEKMSLRILEADKNQDAASRKLITAQESLKKLTDAGIASGPDYEKAVLGLSIAQAGLQISTEKAKNAHEDLLQSELGFALSVVPTVMGSITALTGVIDIMKAAKLGGAGATALEAAADSGGIASKIAHTGATIAHTFATNAAALATRLLNLAMGPVGWIILGVSGAMALFATNAFGIRDAINAAGKAIGDAIPILKPLLDMLGGLAKTIFPETEKATESAADTTSASLEEMIQKYKDQMPAATDMQAGVTDAFNGMSLDSSAALASLAQSFGTNASSMVSDAERVRKAMESIKGSGNLTEHQQSILDDPRKNPLGIGAQSPSIVGGGLGTICPTINNEIKIYIDGAELRKLIFKTQGRSILNFV